MIRREVGKLIALHDECFPNDPVVDSQGVVRVKNVRAEKVTWNELVQRSPAFYETFYAEERNPDEYGKKVHSDIEAIRADLRGKCKRKFYTLLLECPSLTFGSHK